MAEQQVVGRIRGMKRRRTRCDLIGQVLENDEFGYRGVWLLTVTDAWSPREHFEYVSGLLSSNQAASKAQTGV